MVCWRIRSCETGYGVAFQIGSNQSTQHRCFSQQPVILHSQAFSFFGFSRHKPWRLADSVLNLTGDNAFAPRVEGSLMDVPSSRFLRPYSSSLSRLSYFQHQRIIRGMTSACISGKTFHLWWHPHNFGVNLQENLIILESILVHYRGCQERYGMVSSNMGDLACWCKGVNLSQLVVFL